MRKFKRGRPGAFTLIELLAVLAIIAALVALCLAFYPKMSDKMEKMENGEAIRQERIKDAFEKTNEE